MERMTARFLLLSWLAVWAAVKAGAGPQNIERSYTDYVDPMLGTSSSRWMLYPGPRMLFGMVSLIRADRL